MGILLLSGLTSSSLGERVEGDLARIQLSGGCGLTHGTGPQAFINLVGNEDSVQVVVLKFLPCRNSSSFAHIRRSTTGLS
ncbi:hypothetical protein CapIbe_023942 [Capra ibex]